MEKMYREIRGTLVALFYAVLIQIFLIQPFYVPSASMYPALEVGDFLITTKPSYGYSQYSVPFAFIPFKGRFFEGAPTRGDIVVFSGPENIMGNPEELGAISRMLHHAGEFIEKSILHSPPHTNYIKRLIGMPGDRIQMIKGVLYINGEECKLEKAEDYTFIDPRYPGDVRVVPQYYETFPGDTDKNRRHRILKALPFGDSRLDDTKEFTVPVDHYFFMGDNRDNSEDSRSEKLGFIHKDHLIGPAKLIWFSSSAKWYQPLQWISGLRLHRFFNSLSQ